MLSIASNSLRFPQPVLKSGIDTGTPHFPLPGSPYNEFMQRSLSLLGVCLLFLGGCKKQPQMDYSALDQSGMWTSNVDQLKSENVTPAEVSQLAKLKQAGASDDLCIALFKAARDQHHDFSSGDSAVNLSRAGYSDAQILEMAHSDQIDILSGDAVMLKLIGLSNEQAEALITRREALRNHSHTDFVRVHGRKPR